MKAIEYIKLLSDIDRVIKYKSLEREEILARGTNTASHLDGMPHTKGNSDKVGGAAVKLEYITNEIKELTNTREAFKGEVIACMKELDIKRYEALYRYYILDQTWEEVAEAMYYSQAYIYKLKTSGLYHMKINESTTLEAVKNIVYGSLVI